MTFASSLAADFAAPSSGNSPIALWRLYLLRGGYLPIAAGMGMQKPHLAKGELISPGWPTPRWAMTC